MPARTRPTSQTLQWGRNFIVAETRRVLPLYLDFLEASVGPQLYRCGNYHVARQALEEITAASMGPQLYRCGNYRGRRNHNKHTDASMGPQLYRCGNTRPTKHRRRTYSGFNGAATLSLRKFGYRAEKEYLSEGFNGAATLSLRKCLVWVVYCCATPVASMGPQLYRCGNLPI